MDYRAIVFVDQAGETIPAGRLALTEDGRYSRAEFNYGQKYLKRPDAVAIDPVQLPLTAEPKYTEEDFILFNGIRDAAPDAWGRKLIDFHMLHTKGRPAGEAEYLLASQQGTRIGALQFGPTTAGPGPVVDTGIAEVTSHLGTLDAFQDMIDRFEAEETISDRYLDFVARGSDLGGARPKGTVMIENHPWLVKFGLQNDRITMAAAEAGCLDLCEMAGLEVCERQVIDIAGRPALLLKRFDRKKGANGGLERRHMISGLTLLGAHERDLGIYGYADLYNGARQHCTASDYGEEIYKRMIMNVLCGNTDDHYRNHAFLMNEDGRYEPSPVYDVTPTTGLSSTRNLFFHLGKAGSGREATLEAAVAAAPSLGLSHDRARETADDLSDLVAQNWRSVLSDRGASRIDLETLENSFSEAGKRVDSVNSPDQEQYSPGPFPV